MAIKSHFDRQFPVSYFYISLQNLAKKVDKNIKTLYLQASNLKKFYILKPLKP